MIKDSCQFFEIGLLLSFFLIFYFQTLQLLIKIVNDTIWMFIKSKQISCHTFTHRIIFTAFEKSNLVLTDNTKLYEYMIYHTSNISCQTLSLFAGVVHRIHFILLLNYVLIFHVVRQSIELFFFSINFNKKKIPIKWLTLLKPKNTFMVSKFL